MRPRAALALVVLVACAEPGVRTESAMPQTAPATTAPAVPSGPEPPATAVPDTEVVPDTEPPPVATAPATEPPSSPPAGEPSTSSGDSLLPELGSSDLDVQSYDVRLDYDSSTQQLAGTVAVTTRVTRPLDELALDATDLVVEAVTVDGAAATFEQTSSELLVRPVTPVGPDAPAVVVVTYRDDDHASGSAFGLGSGWYPTAGGSYVLNEPDGSRSWLPSNDHPSDKATWRFELTVPAGVTAVANGHLVEQRPDGAGTTWVWEQREPMATYLVQVLTGDYEVLDGGMAGGTPLTDVALRADVERMQPYFDLTAEQLAFFEPLFGRYPLDQYGLAFADSEPGLAMETQGRSMFARDDFPAGTPDELAHLFLSHELAHQWFGNAVTPADWADLWLNESFASYAQWLWLDHVGMTDLEQEAAVNLMYRQIPTEPTGKPSVANLFGYERYDGGAVVVHALRRELGDDPFFTLLQRWVAENDGASRTTADFIALAEDVAGRPLGDFFDAWLYADSVPADYPT